ncbi:MAG: phosphoesterase RecJ domain protein [Haloplasmataceae bacterium]|jgi:c-di-AMP phosphodiesterase-like protein|nr:phosphoesterase RecJ domain protein [Haloplasmataceae bacterium]
MEKKYKIRLTTMIAIYAFIFAFLVIDLILNYESERLIFSSIITTMIATQILFLYKYYSSDSKAKAIDELGYHIRKVGSNTFNNFPVSIIVYNDKFVVEWVNYNTRKLLGTKNVGKHLKDIDRTLYEKLSIENFTVEINHKIFEVKHFPVYRTLYLMEVTERENKIRSYENKQLAVGYIVLDNLEEAISDLSEQKRHLFLGRVTSMLIQYASENNILIKNYSEGRFLLFFEYATLQKLVLNKFDLLNKMKKVSEQFDTNLTMSIGIAYNQPNLIALNDKALEALELTQSRGGDQVAIMYSEKDIKFFGGKSNIVEKRNRVRARVVAHDLQELIDKADKVIIMGHKIPDVDAFGACIGVLSLARKSEKECFIVIDTKEIDNTLQKVFTYLHDNNSNILSKVVSPQIALDLVTSKTLLVVVDTQNPSLVIEAKFLNRVKNIVVIDHHRRGTKFIESPNLIYTEIYASSTVELISEIIEYYPIKVQITDLEATVMLAGIIVDTNNFTYRTGSRTFEAASFLRKQGADTLAVQTMLRESYEEHMLRAELFEKVELTKDNMAIVMADNIANLTKVKLAQTADWLLMIENVKASYVIGKIDANTIGISSRSFGEVNVQLIMEKMGGGGHFNNAASQLKDKTLQEAYNMLLQKIDEYLEEEKVNENNITK